MRWAGPTTSGPTHWPDAACAGFRQLAEGPLHAPGVCAAPQRSYSLKDSCWRCRVGRYSAFLHPYALPCALQNALQAMWRPRRRFLGLKGLRGGGWRPGWWEARTISARPTWTRGCQRCAPPWRIEAVQSDSRPISAAGAGAASAGSYVKRSVRRMAVVRVSYACHPQAAPEFDQIKSDRKLPGGLRRHFGAARVDALALANRRGA